MKFLVVDDDHIFRGDVSGMLRRQHHVVIEASDGDDGLKKALINRDLDVIISDQNMPELTGTSLFLKLQSAEHPAERVLMSNDLTQATLDEAQKAGLSLDNCVDKMRIVEFCKKKGWR